MSIKGKVFIVFCFLIGIVFIGFNYVKDNRITRYLDMQANQYNIMYDVLYSKYQEQSDLIFNNFINKDNIINIYTKLQNATPQDIDKLHIELYNIRFNEKFGGLNTLI